jgi:hypothetical protein
MKIEINEKVVARTAAIVKRARLENDPMMDSVAVALNCQPTYKEIHAARIWILAYEKAKLEEAGTQEH